MFMIRRQRRRVAHKSSLQLERALACILESYFYNRAMIAIGAPRRIHQMQMRWQHLLPGEYFTLLQMTLTPPIFESSAMVTLATAIRVLPTCGEWKLIVFFVFIVDARNCYFSASRNNSLGAFFYETQVTLIFYLRNIFGVEKRITYYVSP